VFDSKSLAVLLNLDKYNIEFITLRKEFNGNEFLQKLPFFNVKFLQITSTLKV
jgi:hypothetical protein